MKAVTTKSLHYKIVTIVLAVWVAVWLVGITFITQYVHPNGEDLLLAQKARDQGILRSATEFLMTFDGRYFTNIMHGLSPLAFGWYEGFHAIPLLMIVVFTTATALWLRRFVTVKDDYEVVVYATLFTAVSIDIAPSLPHQLLIYCGTIVYFIPWSFLFMSLFFFWLHYHNHKHITYFLLAAVFLIMANGCNEMFLVLNGTTLLLLTWLVFRSCPNKEIQLSVYALWLVYIGTSLFFITSPGIVFRLANSEVTQHSMLLHERMLYGLSEFFWVYVPRFFTSGLPAFPAAFLIAVWIHRHRSYEFNVTIRQMLVVLLCLMLAIVFSTAAYYTTIAGPGDNADRIYNTVYTGFFLMMILGWSMILQTGLINNIVRPVYTIGALVIFIVSTIIAEDNIHLVWKEWRSGQIAAFDQQVRQRIETIREAAASAGTCKIVYVKAYDNKPRSIWHDSDLAPERKHYYWNRAYERYFYVDEVRLEGDTFKMLF